MTTEMFELYINFSGVRIFVLDTREDRKLDTRKERKYYNYTIDLLQETTFSK